MSAYSSKFPGQDVNTGFSISVNSIQFIIIKEVIKAIKEVIISEKLVAKHLYSHNVQRARKRDKNGDVAVHVFVTF